MEPRPTKQRILYLRVFVVAIFLTISGGWLLSDYLGKIAEKGFKERIDREANLIAALLNDYLEDGDNTAKALSQAHSMFEALSPGNPADLERAARTLNRFKNSLEMSACYLLDRNGLVVSSSSGNGESESAGKPFPFWLHIRGALTGRLTRYFARDGSSRERSYYAAAAVTDGSGTTTGVIVIRRNITPIEAAFGKHPHAFLVSPEGVIFITSREQLLFRALWPLDEKSRSALLASGQFGNIGFEPLLTAEPRNGTYVRLSNRKHFVQRLAFGSEGWTLVSMEWPGIVSSYRLFGALLTIILGLLLLFFYIVLRNKEESLEAAGNLLKAKEDWRRTIDAVPDLIVIIDTDHRIISMNRAMAERLGISPQEAIGRRCFELLHGMSEPSSSCPHSKMLESGRAVSETVFEKRLNGSFVVTAAPILAEDGTLESSVHVMHDVTEQARLADEVNRIHNLESIGILAGGLAHDFNNVLNIICGNISFARTLAEGNAAVCESLADAEEGCERAKELGTRLSAFSKGSSPLKEPIALPTIIEDAAVAAFKDSNILHTVSAADDLFPLEADPRQIRQVFENLLSNAKEAMPDGGKVGIEIDNFVVDGKKMLPLGAGRYVRISLQDNGNGIPKENLPKIFDPYFSTKDAYSQKGLGLGLSICHAILKRHKGHISVESESGIGTRVSVYLPAAAEETKVSPGG